MVNRITCFEKKVDKRSRQAMIDFLSGHFRYNTMNSWNRATSYAQNVKIHRLPLTIAQQGLANDLLNVQSAYNGFSRIIRKFGEDHGWDWQAGFNGRSGGYLVLLQGGSKDSGYKSECTACGQLNYKTIEETKGNRCGRCGEDERVNLTKPVMNIFAYPGRGLDMNEDFEEWDIGSIKDRVELVKEFDCLCDDCLNHLINLLTNYEVREKTVCEPKSIKVLQRKAA